MARKFLYFIAFCILVFIAGRIALAFYPEQLTRLSFTHGGAFEVQPALRPTPPSSQVTCTVQHTVFVPDAFSVDQRSDTAQAAGWRGIILWAFGYESSDLYQVLAS